MHRPQARLVGVARAIQSAVPCMMTSNDWLYGTIARMKYAQTHFTKRSSYSSSLQLLARILVPWWVVLNDRAHAFIVLTHRFDVVLIDVRDTALLRLRLRAFELSGASIGFIRVPVGEMKMSI